ncbi:MAG TPA: FAD:protein FMN transferase [Dermatophilaceae bacterium]|nr:FAD:protein FMN transferase [Dermatophilaceae bacterium]
MSAAAAAFEPPPQSVGWKALGSYVHLQLADAARLDEGRVLAEAVLEEVDRSCSRFRLDSDLTRANGRPGLWTPVSPVLAAAVQVALEAARHTGGLVDPALGAVMVAAGYDRTFDLLTADTAEPAALPIPVRPGAWQEIRATRRAVFVPHGVRLDLGATGKAFAADLAAAQVCDRLDTPTAISVGGDVAVAAPRRQARVWPVAVAETFEDLQTSSDDVTLVTLSAGGLATSTVRARRWRRGGREWHHVIDPRNGLPVDGPWRSATALGHTCTAANTATTAALVLGEGAMDWLDRHRVAAVLVDRDGGRHPTRAWADTVEARFRDRA